ACFTTFSSTHIDDSEDNAGAVPGARQHPERRRREGPAGGQTTATVYSASASGALSPRTSSDGNGYPAKAIREPSAAIAATAPSAGIPSVPLSLMASLPW